MVGSSVNCHAEMSTAEISSIPSWKIALLERKRLHDKESAGPCAGHTPNADRLSTGQTTAAADSGVPSWKRDILTRKQNQKNSLVFLAKPGPTEDSDSVETAPTINNGHVHPLTTEPGADATTVVDIDVTEAVEGPPVEERLLPIHQNPILRLDLKNRHQSSGSLRSSTSPRIITGSATSSCDRNSTVSSSASMQVPVTPDVAANEEVFSTDNDGETEFAYGKGFVHKLLMKFSHLSSTSGDQTNNRFPKQRFASLSESSKHSATAGSRTKSSQDLESIPSRPPSGMPTARYHSADDLLNETKFPMLLDQNDLYDEIEIAASGDLNGDADSHLECDDVKLEVVMNSSGKCLEIPDELPFANIVSNARSLFERLAVHSSSQKPSPSSLSVHNTSSCRFAYTGTLERSIQAKNTSVPPSEVNSKLHTDNKQSDNPDKSDKSEIIHVNGTLGDAASRESHKVITKPAATKSLQESIDRTNNNNVLDSGTKYASEGGTYDKVFSVTPSSCPASFRVDLSANDVQSPKMPPTEQDNETTKLASKTALDDPHSVSGGLVETTYASAAAKPIHVENSLSLSQPADDKENVNGHVSLSRTKKSTASRPGKLVIRPASNLVAAKTSAEYLEMTKFNDVRKGEFAPPTKKDRIDLSFYEDDVDRVDGVGGDAVAAEEFDFSGAGVVIGRSLLTKTNRNRSVNTLSTLHHFDFITIKFITFSENPTHFSHCSLFLFICIL